MVTAVGTGARRAVLPPGGAFRPWTRAGQPHSPVAGYPAGLAARPAISRNPALFFTDPSMNEQALLTVGAAGYGAAEYGEFAAAVAGVHRGGDTYDAYYREFRSIGLTAGRFGREAYGNGNLAAARGAFLRAACYLAGSLYFVLGTSRPRRQAAVYRAMDGNWSRAARLLGGEPVQIGYGPTTMPGWLLRPPGARPGSRRPTVIFGNGFSGQNVSLYVHGAAEAVALGYNALLFEGPGQGSMLFLRGIPLRPDWDAVITPVVEYLRGRPDVDPRRIALIGWRQGGVLAARAAAAEHRLAALVLDPGVTDVMAAFHLPAQLAELARSDPAEADAVWASIFPRLPASDRFRFTKSSYPFRQPGFSALVRALARYGSAESLPEITTPTLVTSYQGAAAVPGEEDQPVQRLRCPHSRHEFGGAAGGGRPGGPMTPHRRNQVIFDWLSGILG